MSDDNRRLGKFILKTHEEAELVIEQSRAIIEQRGMISVGDLLTLLGFTFGNFKDDLLGWRDLSNATFHSEPDGYVLDFPEATPLT